MGDNRTANDMNRLLCAADSVMHIYERWDAAYFVVSPIDYAENDERWGEGVPFRVVFNKKYYSEDGEFTKEGKTKLRELLIERHAGMHGVYQSALTEEITKRLMVKRMSR